MDLPCFEWYLEIYSLSTAFATLWYHISSPKSAWREVGLGAEEAHVLSSDVMENAVLHLPGWASFPIRHCTTAHPDQHSPLMYICFTLSSVPPEYVLTSFSSLLYPAISLALISLPISRPWKVRDPGGALLREVSPYK